MRERGYVNGDRADSFDISLTNNQKEQYGLQFDNKQDTPTTQETPGIISKIPSPFFPHKKISFDINFVLLNFYSRRGSR